MDSANYRQFSKLGDSDSPLGTDRPQDELESRSTSFWSQQINSPHLWHPRVSNRKSKPHHLYEAAALLKECDYTCIVVYAVRTREATNSGLLGLT